MEMFGRAVERTTIDGALAEALAGRGGLVLLSGEAGIGKTALAQHASGQAEAQGAVVTWGRCREGVGAPAFWPWMQVVQPWPQVAEDADRFELFERVAAALSAAATPAGLVAVLDDLHWADDASIRLLDHLASSLQDSRLLIVGTFRADEVVEGHPLNEILGGLARHGSLLSLRGLGVDEVVAIAREAVGVALDHGAAAAVRAHTDGNPFFVTEVVRLLASEDRLHDLGGNALGVPSGVAAVVRRRVARLGEEGAAVLAAAAVIGRSFDEGTLEALVDGGADVDKAIDGALTASLVEAEGGRGDRFRFSHAIVREVVYGDLPRRRRIRLHAELATRIGDSLAVRAHHALAGASVMGVEDAAAIAVAAAESTLAAGGWEEADRLATQALDLKPGDEASYRAFLTRGWAAFHLDRPQESTADCLAAAEIAERQIWPERLAASLLGVGSGRFTGSAFALPPVLFDACLAMLDDGIGSDALRSNLISRKVDLQPLGAKDLEASSTAVQMARTSGDQEALVVAVSRYLLNFCFQGPLGSRRALVNEAIGTVPFPRHEVGRHALDAIALDVRVLMEEGRLDQALIRLADVARHKEISDGAIDLRFHEPVLACIATQRGDFDKASAASQSWIDQASRRGTAVGGLLIQTLQIMVLRERGLWDLVLPVVELARQTTPATEVELITILEATTALGLAELGRDDEAVRAIEVVLAHDLAAISRSWGGIGMAACCWLAEAAALTGHQRAASVLAPVLEPATDRNVVMGMPPIAALGWGAYYAGLCALTLGRLDEAREQLFAALLAHERMGAWPVAARTRFHLARLEAADASVEAAMLHATESRLIARSLGMDVWHRRADLLVEELQVGAGHEALSGTLTFVFTDIEGSTQQTATVGDQAWASTMTEHGRVVRRLVAQHGGRVVKGLGDGFMLIFPSARAAVSCAASLQEAVSGSATRVRIGVHTGEAEMVDGDYFGHHVNLAARVSGAADAGEILLSSAVQQIVATSGVLRFGAPRHVSLKGISDEQLLWPLLVDLPE